MKNVLLFNATGAQGAAIAQRLLARNYRVLAPVRSEANIDKLQAQGMTAFLSNFSTASLLPIIEQADQVILQIPAAILPEKMLTIATQAMEAISQAGHPRTIFVISSTITKVYTGIRSVDVRLQMVELARKKMPATPILSATEYLENFSTAYRQAILENGVIPQTIPPSFPVNYLSWNDLATYVVAALESDQLTGGVVYPIGGIEGISGQDLAQRLGKVLGKTLSYVPVSHQELEGILTPIMGAEVAKDYAEFYHWQDTDGATLLNPDTQTLRELLGIELATFEEWARKAF